MLFAVYKFSPPAGEPRGGDFVFCYSVSCYLRILLDERVLRDVRDFWFFSA